ncbi:MAG: hypothetical protein HGA44_12155 [Cellulomonadaceae bacterium]|nr:hypothetical protein [Cellulomonadaceae bacterium]
MTRVPVALLRRASDLLLNHLESVAGESVVVDADFFWSIGPEQTFDAFVEPSSFTVGQLSECLEHLERIVDDPSRATSFALVWLSDLLRGAGQAVIR